MNILIACTQYPYHGGAATNSYALVKALRKRGHNVCGLFFENKTVDCDPDNIGGILSSKLQINKESLRKNVINFFKGKPNIILAKNYVAPIYCRKLFPNSKIVYLVSGSPLMVPLSRDGISAIKYLSLMSLDIENKYGKELPSSEAKAIKLSDAVLLNSEISRQVFLKTYPKISKKCKIFSPLNTSMIINKSAKNQKEFQKRRIDIAFVCSSLSRTVKNAEFARKIFKHKSLKAKTKLVIGSGGKRFADIPNIIIKKKTNNKEVMKYLGQTKLVICTSFFDASPNIVNEAIASGCNILVSKNCGWSAKYGKESVCNDVYNTGEWVRKIYYLCNNKVSYASLDSREKSLDKLEVLIHKVVKL